MSESNWKESTPETLEKINYIYTMLITVADSPVECAEILSGVFVRAWISGKTNNADIDKTLKLLCLCIRTNVEHIEASVQ